MPSRVVLRTICQMFRALFSRQQEISFMPVLFRVRAVTEFLLLGSVYLSLRSLREYTQRRLS